MKDFAIYKFAVGDEPVVDARGAMWVHALYVVIARDVEEARAFAAVDSPYDLPWITVVEPVRIEIGNITAATFVTACRCTR